MNSWTGSERLALATTVVANLLMAWGLGRMLAVDARVVAGTEDPVAIDVVFLPPRQAGVASAPMRSKRQPQAPIVARRIDVDRRDPRADAASLATQAVATAVDSTGTSRSSSAALDLRLPEVTFLAPRKPWERAPVRDPAPTRFASQWREPMSVRDIIGVITRGGIKDPNQLCSDGERMMQQRGCAPLLGNVTYAGQE